MIYPKNFEHKIGFSEIRKNLEQLCRTLDAKKIAAAMSFQSDYNHVLKLINTTEEMRLAVSDIVPSRRFPFDFPSETNLLNIEVGLKSEGAHLSAEDLLLLLKVFYCLDNICRYFDSEENGDNRNAYPLLTGLSERIVRLTEAKKEIERIFTPDGEIKDNASKELSDIRNQLRSIGKNMGTAMQRIISNAVSRGIIESDVTPVMREGRLVLPLQPMYKRALGGIVHGESATGRTVFVEPAEMVEINNRLRELELEEQREILNILTKLTEYLKEYDEEIINNLRLLVRFDFIHAKALLAVKQDGQCPHVAGQPEFEWYHAINPVLERSLKEQGKEPVPLELKIDKGARILIVSGPNAGGKSVLLKTVGLLQYMLQCGLLPPVHSNSRFGIFKDIFLDIGDNQSIEDDLSTYSSHLQTMKTFLNKGNPHSLVLIDEFGSGTEPTIGGAIAEAVLIELNNKGCWGVVTTHYRNIKLLAENTPGLLNGSMLFDRNEMRPLFMLSPGNAGSSFAIEIARKAGLPRFIIDKATEIVGQDYVDSDKYLLDINRDRKYWENKRYEIKIKEKRLDDLILKWEKETEDIRNKRKALVEEAKKDARKIIKEANANIEKTIKEIKEAQAERDATRVSRHELEEFRKKLEEDYIDKSITAPPLRRSKKQKQKKTEIAQSDSTHVFNVGDLVTLDGKDVPGEILEINGRKATVSFGPAKIVVEQKRLAHSDKKKIRTVKLNTGLTKTALQSADERRKSFKTEIDVRGMRADEAVQAVTYFIDDAVQFNISPVRILHGTGTGALREAIRKYLGALGSDIIFHDEDVRLGGAGITVVSIR